MPSKQIAIAALLLGAFAVAGTALVAVTFEATRDRIAANERAALLRSLNALVSAERHDNDLFADTLQVTAPAQLGTHAPVTVYRARRAGKPVAAVLTPVAPDGYSGRIRLLVAINDDGKLAGVRVVAHRETPGLGDLIEETRSDWIHGFDGRSLQDPKPAGWKVKRDGGVFDQFTGATITPRAVVKAVYKTLIYSKANWEPLFAPPSDITPSPNKPQ